MAKFWSAAMLVIAGLIVADLVTHGQETEDATNSVVELESNTGNQLLGNPSSTAKAA